MRIPLFLCALVALPTIPSSRATQRDGVIVNLYDAFGKAPKGTELAWGYSALVRFHGKTILFDSGGDTDRFARNTKALGVDLKTVDYAVLSHSHSDHSSGFDYALKANPVLKIYMPDDSWLGGGSGLPLPAVPKDVAPGVFLIATRSTSMGNFSRPHPDDAPELNGIPERHRGDCTEDAADGRARHTARHWRFPPATVQRRGDPTVGRAAEGRAGSAAGGAGSLHGNAGFPHFSRGVWEGLCCRGPRVGGAVCAIGGGRKSGNE